MSRTVVDPKDRCTAKVSTAGDIWSRHEVTCSRRATVVVDGRGYCKQHSPDSVAAKQAKRASEAQELRDARGAAEERLHRLAQRLGVDACGYKVWTAKWGDPFTGISLSFEDAERIADALEREQ